MSKVRTTDQGIEPANLFDSLFTTHHEAVFKYCVRRLGVSEAEDAAADVFAVAWRRLDEIPLGDGTRAWLIGVAYKVVGNSFRSRRRRTRLSQRIEAEQRVVGNEGVAVDLETQLVLLALENLSATDRELIRLSSWDGLSRSEIGAVLGIRVNAVDQRLHRARARLRNQFDKLVARDEASSPEEAQI